MNVELLRKIAVVIQEKPAEFDMENWHSDPTKWTIWAKPEKAAKACGTTHCIAGWAHIIDGRFPKTFTMDAATKILELTEEQRERLFFSDNWPDKFQGEEGVDDDAPRIPASLAAARIEHFIATGGAE